MKQARRSLRPTRPVDPVRIAPNGPFIFIHINKTAGTSICRALGIPGPIHSTVREVIDAVGEQRFRAARSFTVVRNPWDKVVSHYSYRVDTNRTGLGDRHLAFPRWVAKTYGDERDRRYYDNPKMFQPQVEWLRDASDRLAVDRILRFERLESDFASLVLDLGANVELPHLKTSDRGNYRQYYDARSIETVAARFAEDIAEFGYTFD